MHPRRPQPSAQFSAPICRPQASAQPRSLITSGFFSPPISSHPLAPTPSAAVRAVLRTHLPSAAVRAAKVAHHQRLLLPNHFQPPQPSAQRLLLPTRCRCTQAVRNRLRTSPHPLPVRSRPRSQARSSPAASPHPFPATPLPPRRPQPSTQFSAPISRPQPFTSGFFPQPLPCTHAVPPPICRPQPSAQPSSLITSGFFSPHPFAVRTCPRSQGRSSPATSSPHPFPATPLHSRHPQPSAQFSASICRPQPSAQPSSLITSGFFSPPISSHSVAPTPSAAVHAVLRTHLPSAAVRAAKLAHHQRLLLPTHFQPLRCTHAVRSHPRSSPHPCRPQPSAQPRSLITSGFFSPPISSHPLAPTPSAAVRAVLRTHLPSAAVRAAKVAHHQRLLLPTHFQPLRCTHANRSRPRSSPHPFAVRSRPRSQGRSSPTASSLSRPRSSPHPFAVRSRPRSQGRSSPAASSPHPFPAAPLHPRRPQPSAQFSAPICHPQPSAQPRSLITSGFSPPISSHSVAPTPSAAVHAVLRTHLPSAGVRAAKVAHHQRLLLSTHFQPPPCTHAVRSRPRSSPDPFAVRSRPRSQGRSSPAASLPFPSFPILSLPFPSCPFPFLSLPFPSFPFLFLLPTHFQPLRCTHAVRSHPRSSPHPSTQFSAPICCPQPSAQLRSLITSGFFSPPIDSHSVAPTPSAAVRAVLRTHLPSAAVRAAKVAHHQRLLLPTHFQPLRCTHAARSRPRSSPHPFAVRSRPHSQGRSSPAASSPHPFPATPLHPRPQPSAQFSAPICRPQPSAQPRSLITSGFFSPPISSHPLAPTPSAAVRAVLRTHLLSAAVRAAKVAHHQRLLLPTHFQPPPCAHSVRSRPRSSPHPFPVRSRPRSQGRSSPAASSLHPFPATPLHPRRPQPSAQFSAPICRPQPSAQPRSLITSGFFSPLR